MMTGKNAFRAAGLCALSFTGAALAGSGEVILEGLNSPVGLEADADGVVWVSEMGVPKTPSDPGVGRVGFMSRNLDGTFTHVPLVENIDVAFNELGEPAGAHHIAFGSDGSLLLAVGGPNIGPYPNLGSVIRYDPTFGSIVDGPYPVDGAATISETPIFPYIVSNGFDDSNVYSVVEVGSDLWIADAGANAVVKLASDGTISTLAVFPDLVNPKGTNPPVSQAVPTRIIADGNGGAFVVVLTGYPFVAGGASIHRLDAAGNISEFATGLSTLIDVEVAADGSLIVSSAGEFNLAGQPVPFTGSVSRVRADGSSETLIEDLFLPTGIEIVGEDLWVTSLALGTVTRYSGLAPQACFGDLNGDGRVDAADLGLLVAAWNACP